jgi:hypothetical protein
VPVASHTVHFTVHVLHNAMKYDCYSNTNDSTCLTMHTTLPSYKYLFLKQERYLHKIGNCWFHWGRMEKLEHLQSSIEYNTHSTHHYIYYTLHFTVYFLIKRTFSDANRAVMWWYALRKRRYNLERLGENGTLHSLSQHMWNSTIKIHLHFVHTTTHLPLITVHIS